MKSRALVTGAAGMLGKDVVELLCAEGFQVYVFDRQLRRNEGVAGYFQGDLTNGGVVGAALRDCDPDVIVHCAANVNLDQCETDRASTYSLHVESVRVLASHKPGKTQLVYISTDSVFDGVKGGYSEDDEPAPLNYYAQTKLEGERAALSTNPLALVLRTNIYGFHIPPGASLAEWALKSWSAKGAIDGFSDVYFNPVYTKQLASVLCSMIKKQEIGILNVGSEQDISKYEFLSRLAGEFRVDAIAVRRSSVQSMQFKVQRPRNTTIRTNKLKSILGVVPEIREGLHQFHLDYETAFGAVRYEEHTDW